jgi:hypothetical protein
MCASNDPDDELSVARKRCELGIERGLTSAATVLATAGTAKPDPHSPRRFGEAAVACTAPTALRYSLPWPRRQLTSRTAFAAFAAFDPSRRIGSRSALRAPAMGAAFLGASQAHRRLCGSGIAAALVVFAT